MDDFINVAKTSDLAEDETMMVEVGDKRIVLSNIGGRFYAIGQVCPHAETVHHSNNSLCKGESA